tara:strand:+ start:1688 stop:1888 length:201 start_codon:yes stop_codon:yes gene_type:complete
MRTDFKPTLTSVKEIKNKRNEAIISDFKTLNVKGSMITAIVSVIALKHAISYSSAYKIVKDYRDAT